MRLPSTPCAQIFISMTSTNVTTSYLALSGANGLRDMAGNSINTLPAETLAVGIAETSGNPFMLGIQSGTSTYTDCTPFAPNTDRLYPLHISKGQALAVKSESGSTVSSGYLMLTFYC